MFDAGRMVNCRRIAKTKIKINEIKILYCLNMFLLILWTVYRNLVLNTKNSNDYDFALYTVFYTSASTLKHGNNNGKMMDFMYVNNVMMHTYLVILNKISFSIFHLFYLFRISIGSLFLFFSSFFSFILCLMLIACSSIVKRLIVLYMNEHILLLL